MIECLERKEKYTPTEFVCKFHGLYQDSPAHNLNWGGCSKYLQDNPKVEIGEILTKMNYWFKHCVTLGDHRFDFALVEKSHRMQ